MPRQKLSESQSTAAVIRDWWNIVRMDFGGRSPCERKIGESIDVSESRPTPTTIAPKMAATGSKSFLHTRTTLRTALARTGTTESKDRGWII
jgi:hypothetical protein